MTTIFNIIEAQSQDRYHIFLQILALIKQHGMYDELAPQLKVTLDRWLQEWKLDDEQERELYMQLADTAEAAGRDE